jgi:glycosyltransferase involved in cell wall biosynthesis
MYKVSVIVPIYNVEKYIVQCAESLFNQTLDEMQFIFVDDASPDNSIARLEQTLERFPQRKPQTIILHHPKNLGLPTARATGLAYVNAPYVAHCDSDDYVDRDMYTKLYEDALQNDSDMVICGRMCHCNNKEFSIIEHIKPDESLIDNYLHGRLKPAVWSRLTKTDIYRKVQFPIENTLEDWGQTAQLLFYSQKVSFVNEALYHYNRREMSITTDNRPEANEEKIRQCILNYNLMHDFITERCPVKEIDFTLFKMKLRFNYLPLIQRHGIREKYMQTFNEINISLLFDRNIPLHYKCTHLLILLGFYSFARPFYKFIVKKCQLIKSEFRKTQIKTIV